MKDWAGKLGAVAALIVAIPVLWSGITLAVNLSKLPHQYEVMQTQMDRIDRNVAKIAMAAGVVLADVQAPGPRTPQIPMRIVSKDVIIPTRDNYEYQP